MIERRIVIGLITSTEYLNQIRSSWDDRYLQSKMASRISGWCIEYYDKYNKAPNQDIEGIYFSKLKAKPPLPQDIAEEIEEDILPGLSDEYEREKFNVNYLLDQTRIYFKERSLTLFAKDISAAVHEGELSEAEKIASKYNPLSDDLGMTLDLGSEIVLERLETAFTQSQQPIVKYPRALGEFWNSQMTRGSFVGFMGTEKRGKTFRLLDISMMANRQGANVAFFQAGDMTEGQFLIRVGEYLVRKSHLKESCEEMYEPIRDCVHNQMDTCDKKERVCDFGIFSEKTKDEIREDVHKDDIIEKIKGSQDKKIKGNPDYKPCTLCKKEYRGSVWLKKIKACSPLTFGEAEKAYASFFLKTNRQFRVATYFNGTLSNREIKTTLDMWERQDGFVPDLITVDYADIMVADPHLEFRHGQNEIWKGLRNISQERHGLVITVTQADAASYEKNRLRMKNFSEDKRKYAHVTAMYGLNQDANDREKELGIMRINELVKREGLSSSMNEVTVLQNLSRGRPFLSSYW